jgi:transcriptional regulator NrdR family protein
MRFASVYQGWESLEDFEAAINVLRASNNEVTDLDKELTN